MLLPKARSSTKNRVPNNASSRTRPVEAAHVGSALLPGVEPDGRHPIIPFEVRVVFGAEKADCVFLTIHTSPLGMASCTPLSFARFSKMTRASRCLRRALACFGVWSLYPPVRRPNDRRICARRSLVSRRVTGSVPRPLSRPWAYRRLWFRGECFRLRLDQTFVEGRHRCGYEACETFTSALVTRTPLLLKRGRFGLDQELFRASVWPTMDAG